MSTRSAAARAARMARDVRAVVATRGVDMRRAALVATHMNDSLKQRLIIALSSVLVGCAVGATMPRLAAQSFPPNPAAQRWEQVCEDTDDNDMNLANRRLAARGAEGFELVAFAESPRDGDIWICFKRPVAR